MNQDTLIRRVIKPAVFTLALIPFALLLWNATQGRLGANPIEAITHNTGDWALRFLLITLAVTPLRRLSGWHALIRLRRMLGLFAFFYALLHLSTWLVLDQFFDLQAMIDDIIDRPYITVGMASFVILAVLAATSTNGMIKRLGGRAWRRLHRLVYVAAVGGVLHYLWLVKADIREPVIYGSILFVLLAYRLWATLREPVRTPTQRQHRRVIPITPTR